MAKFCGSEGGGLEQLEKKAEDEKIRREKEARKRAGSIGGGANKDCRTPSEKGKRDRKKHLKKVASKGKGKAKAWTAKSGGGGKGGGGKGSRVRTASLEDMIGGALSSGR